MLTSLAASAALALAAPVPATASVVAAEQVAIQPGAAIATEGTLCTLAWIFDGRPGTGQEGRVYAATAAHCVPRVGAVTEVRPAESGGPGRERIGVVAFDGDEAVEGRDYAFIEIDPDDHAQVDPRMKGHPLVPAGLPRDPRPGNTIAFSGYGMAFEATGPTREGRTGVLNRAGEREHDVLGAVLPGDSGGPVADLTDGGTAFGIVNTVGAGLNTSAMTLATAGEGGANLHWVLGDAASRGFHVRLRTAAGLNVGLQEAIGAAGRAAGEVLGPDR